MNLKLMSKIPVDLDLKTVHPLHEECEKLIRLGHTPQNVVELARNLMFSDLLTVAFPRMTQSMRMKLITGANVIVRDGNTWSVIEKDHG